VILGAATTLRANGANAVTFAGTVDSLYGLTISASGVTTFGAR